MEDISLDHSATPLVFPDRLYGRDQELATLERVYQETRAGAGRVLLLSGHSGSGKTVLVQAMSKPVREKNGFFLEGKFNQYQQGIPLFALRQSLQQLVHELKKNRPSEQERWRSRLLQAVGDLGRLLTDLVPELETFLGPQPAVPEISPYEAPHRFASVLKSCLTDIKHIYVLLLFLLRAIIYLCNRSWTRQFSPRRLVPAPPTSDGVPRRRYSTS